MAQSRLEKIGTIFTRITSLLKGKAIKEEDTPVWLAVYETFPPKYEPKFDRRLPKKPVRPIFYEEDLVRAKFHKDQRFIPAVNLSDENVKSTTQNFISMYRMIKEEGKEKEESIVYKQAMKQYVSEMEARTESRRENKSSRDS